MRLDGDIASTRARADHCAIAQPKETHARRKAVYEKLHPEAKAGVAQAKGMNTALGNVADKLSVRNESYAADAANAVGDKAPRARGLTAISFSQNRENEARPTRARADRDRCY